MAWPGSRAERKANASSSGVNSPLPSTPDVRTINEFSSKNSVEAVTPRRCSLSKLELTLAGHLGRHRIQWPSTSFSYIQKACVLLS